MACPFKNCGSTPSSCSPNYSYPAACPVSVPLGPTTACSFNDETPVLSRLTVSSFGSGVDLLEPLSGTTPTQSIVTLQDPNQTLDSSFMTLDPRSIIAIVRDASYHLIFSVKVTVLASPIQPLRLALLNLDTGVLYRTVDLVPNQSTLIDWTVDLEAGARLALVVLGNQAADLIRTIRVCGEITASDFPARLEIVTVEANSTFFRYLPARPDNAFLGRNFRLYAPQFGPPLMIWPTNVIPREINQQTTPPTIPVPASSAASDQYNKMFSVPNSIMLFLGLDPATISPDDPRLSVFLTNYVNRGEGNLRKQIYMSALNSNIVPYYFDKIDKFINQLRAAWQTYSMPVLSSSVDPLIRFFLSVHLGEDDYPPYVINYFRLFISVIGFGDPCRPGRDAAIQFGYDNVAKVRLYFEQRNAIINQAKDKSCIMYWWGQAGLNPAGLIMESIHNIIAFNQFLNVIFLVINDQFGHAGTLQPPGVFKRYNFFTLFRNLPDDVTALNYTREIFRLLVPNTASFSKVVQGEPNTNPNPTLLEMTPEQVAQAHTNYNFSLPCTTVDPTSRTLNARHVHKSMMYTNMLGLGRDYATFDPAQYGTNFGIDYNTSIYAQPNPPANNNPTDPPALFDYSPYDHESVIEKCNPQATPVYPLPIYAPFGLGYRRCAGEVFTMTIVQRLMTQIAEMNFVFRPNPTDYPLVPLAPFTDAYDNIFFDQQS